MIALILVLSSTLSGVYATAGNKWTYKGSLGKSVTSTITPQAHFRRGRGSESRSLQTKGVKNGTSISLADARIKGVVLGRSRKAGPQHWHLDYPHCGGVKQSPIDIDTNDVIVDSSHLQPFMFSGYDSVSNVNMSMVNNGHTVQVDLEGTGSEISGGGLPGTFVAQQFHFHWGRKDERGSEHSFNGYHFPMEMHIVHYNTKYGSLGAALDKEDGLAVLAFFFIVGRYNEHFQDIINHFGQIRHASERVNIAAIPLTELIPAKLSTFYRYEGSLTTPPCYETVIWSLFEESIEIAEEQLEDFRTKIYENRAEEEVDVDISDDFRPPQCINSRRVYASQTALKYSIQQHDPTNAGATINRRHIGASITLSFLLCLLNIRLH